MGEFYTKGNEYFEKQDYAKAYELFVVGDKEGDIYCTYKIAVHLANGYAVEKDEKRAKEMFARIFPALNEKANAGDMHAQSILGVAYLNGELVELDYKLSYEWTKKAAEQGWKNAQRNLGYIYINGYGTKKSIEKAIYWYEKAAEDGSANAKNNLAWIYKYIIKDYEKAIYWYEKATEDGYEFARVCLSDMYKDGKGVEKSLEKAFELMLTAAENGDADAQNSVADKYRKGEGVEQDHKKAIYWYKKAAKQENPYSQRYLGECYLRGSGGVSRNVEKANFWFKKALENYEKEAQKGSYVGMYNMARMMEELDGCNVDKEKVKSLYKKYIDCYLIPLAEAGNEISQFILGSAYRDGKGVEQSFEKAEYWFKKASEQGYENAKRDLAELYRDGLTGKRDIQKAISLYQEAGTYSRIGAIYADGIGVDVDFNKAELWYKKGIENGDAWSYIRLSRLYLYHKRTDKYKESIKNLESIKDDAIYGSDAYELLARHYKYGWGTKRDIEKAKEFYKKSFEIAKKNNENLHWYYFCGIGTSKNYKKAFKELLKNQYDGYYQYLIGRCYMQGKGVEKNTALAIEWYEKAANQGEEKAILALGELYYFGQGVEQNYEKAIELFERSAEVTSYDAPYYYLGDCYHHGLGVKADWQKAKRYYEKAIKLGYSCEYALEMVKIDLGEFKRITEMESYAKNISQLNLSGDELRERISKDLKKDFGECWDNLKENAQIAITTGVLTYIAFVSMGEEFCKKLDFSAVIVNFAKSLETELAEFFYKGYITYLKKKKISPSVFPEDSCLLKITKKGNEEIGREYQDENETKNFRLGGLRYIIDDKFEILPSLEDAMQSEHYVKGRSEAYRNYRFKGSYGLRTIDKHMAAYANELFSSSAFSSSNRKKEIVNYLIDLANSVGEIAYQYRNPAAHGDIMAMQKASACGDYLIKVRKLIYGFLSKIKDKYRDGYN